MKEENLHYLYNYGLFEDNFLKDSSYGQLSFQGNKDIIIRTTAKNLELLLKTTVTAETLPKLRNIKYRQDQQSQQKYLSISVSKAEMFPYFYVALSELVENIAIKKLTLEFSLDQALRRIKNLIEVPPKMSLSQEIGLFGELYVMREFININKANFDYWYGYDKNRHDMVFGETSLEVKSTLKKERIHKISSLSQLSNRDNHSLYLVSVMLDQGSGETLKELVSSILKLLKNDVRSGKLLPYCVRAGFDYNRNNSSNKKFSIFSDVQLYQIDDSFPKITRKEIDHIVEGKKTNVKITEATYTIDVTNCKSSMNLNSAKAKIK